MKKIGFTLAEVLITFGIIGVVAAITLPGLNNNISKSKVGPALAKAVNTLEAANKVALLEYDVIALNDIGSETDTYLKNISLQLSGHVNLKPDGVTADYSGFTLKDGITLQLHANTLPKPKSQEGKTPDDKYNYEYYVLIIDVNGSKNPNKGGQDRFMFYVDTAGIVFPAGGTQAERYFRGSDFQGGENSHGSQHLAVDCKEGIPSYGGEYCAGTIMEDNWQIKW